MNGWGVVAAAAIAGLVLVGFDSDRKEAESKLKLERQQGQIEGLQMQLERSSPQVNVTQRNETNGVKLK